MSLPLPIITIMVTQKEGNIVKKVYFQTSMWREVTTNIVKVVVFRFILFVKCPAFEEQDAHVNTSAILLI